MQRILARRGMTEGGASASIVWEMFISSAIRRPRICHPFPRGVALSYVPGGERGRCGGGRCGGWFRECLCRRADHVSKFSIGESAAAKLRRDGREGFCAHGRCVRRETESDREQVDLFDLSWRQPGRCGAGGGY